MSTDPTVTDTTQVTQITHVTGAAYIKTASGICKIIQVISSLIAALLVGIGFYGYLIRIFEIAATVSIVTAIAYLIVYISGYIMKMGGYMNRNQFFVNVMWSVYYLVAVILLLSEGGQFSQIIAGGVFGLIAIIAHIVDAVYNYKKQPLC